MGETRGTARRTNLVICLVALFIISGSVAVALLFDPAPHSTATEPTVAPHSPGSSSRPADTWLSWFDHANIDEQFDHPMETLRCEYLDQYLTNDLCAVAATRHGAFMVSAAEGDWDPDDVGDDGWAKIPLTLTAWVLRTDGTRRAFSILDGYTTKAYSSLAVSMSLFVAEVDGDEVIVIIERLAHDDSDPFDFPATVQVIAMSPSGAPTLVAAYEGINLTVQSEPGSLVISSWRFGAEEAEGGNGMWCTQLRLSPASRDPYGWDETPSSGPCPDGDGISLVSTYTFPVAPDISESDGGVVGDA